MVERISMAFIQSKLLILLLLSFSVCQALPTPEGAPASIKPATGKTTTTTTSAQSTVIEALEAHTDRHDIIPSPTQLSQTTDNTKQKKNKTPKKKKKTTKVEKASGSSSPASTSLRRIKKEYKDAVQMGICYDWIKGRSITSASTNKNTAERHIICLGPLASNLRHWHFSFRGVQDSLYQDGLYHGRIILPKDYPLTPPRVQLWTPSGRFRPFVDICLSASAYHPESWTPRWTVLSLVQALRIHMLTNPQEIGGMSSSREETIEYARKSLTWKISWKTGKGTVRVDHTTLLEQGILNLEDMNEADVDVPSSTSTAPQSDGTIEEQPESLSATMLSTGTMSSTTTIPPKTTKKKKSKGTKTKPKAKIQPANDVSTLDEIPQVSLSISNVLLLVISKLFANPRRVAIVSLVILMWMNRDA